jgi:hypothetical protein
MTRALNLTGKVFGRLHVLRSVGGTRRRWECLCACGTKCLVAQKELSCGDTRSCGCLRREQAVKRNTTHGHARRGSISREYSSWQSMHNRVSDALHKDAHIYYGLRVSKRWEKFEVFLADMGPRPPHTTLDRRNSAKGYTPSNCRWATAEVQANNTVRNRFVRVNGTRMSVSQAARLRGLSPDVVLDRINKLKWSVKRALETPKRKDRRTE